MNTTINISLPKNMYADARNVVKQRRYASVSELIRYALRNILYPSGLTVNGFSPGLEEEVLRSAAESAENDIVLKTNKEINDYFLNLKIPSKMKRVRNGKNSIRARV